VYSFLLSNTEIFSFVYDASEWMFQIHQMLRGMICNNLGFSIFS
jgi:hypothetical protein